jgi:hypothetical protein
MNILWKFISILCAGLFLVACGGSDAQQAPINLTTHTQLSWQPPSIRVDRTALDENAIQGFQIYKGRTPDNLKPYQYIDDPLIHSLHILEIPVGVYYFAVATVDSHGVEGQLSAVVKKDLQ